MRTDDPTPTKGGPTDRFDGGRLRVNLSLAAGEISAVSVASTRPPVARVLVGKTPAAALALVPRLFSLCGRAQGAVAQAALRAAGAALAAGDDWGVRCERVQEHVWRLLLDWPKFLGLTAQGGAFVRWYRRLADATPTQAAALADELAAFLAADVFAGDAARWAAGTTVGGSFADALLDAAAALQLPSGAPPLLPVRPAAAWALPLANPPGDFAAAPRWQGGVAETGALARQTTVPRVARALVAGDAISARLAARLCELAAAPAWLRQPPTPIDAAPVAGSGDALTGLAMAETARGLLLHRVVLRDGRIADYQVVAPTEWNFPAAGGALATLIGQRPASPQQALHWARAVVLALDPCVPAVVKLAGFEKETDDA